MLDRLLERDAPLAPVPGVPELVAHQARDVFGVWEALEGPEADEAREPPFWSLVWPAAGVLARLLLDEPHRVRGRRVLEIGCGGAVAAIAAARAGATEVVANDIDPVALEVAARNARANGVHLTLDPRDLTVEGAAPPEGLGDVVLVADFFYLRAASDRLAERLRRHPGLVLVADGGRPFAPTPDGVLLASREVEVSRAVEGADRRLVRVWTLDAGAHR